MQKNYPGMFNLTKGLMMIAIMFMHAVTDSLFSYGLNVQSSKLRNSLKILNKELRI